MDITLEEYVNIFIENIVLQNEYVSKNNPKDGNKAAKKYIEAFKKIVEKYNDSGRERLSAELSNSNKHVKAMTAAFLLRYKQKESMDVLIELSRENTMLGFAAGETIKRWNEGSWTLDK
jgi:hypothetical protein